MTARRLRVSGAICCAGLLQSSLLAAEPGGVVDVDELVSLSVRVVDVAADRVYVEPGAAQGLRVGDPIRFESGTLKVVSVTRDSAALAQGKQRFSVGARGRTTVPAHRPEHVVLALPKPEPLASFRGQWRDAPRPAASQTPTPVPLRVRERSPNRVLVQDAFYGVVPLDKQPKFFGNEVRGRLHYELLPATPVAFDLDLGVQTFAGDGFSLRSGAAARQVLRVRELSATYGRPTEFRGALGRLRAASTFVGQLDGLRLEAPLATGLRLTAFGGGAPQTFNGMVSADVVRFGGELVYDAPESTLHPRFVAGAYASRFDGALDERKLHAAIDLMPLGSRIGGHTEVSFFDAGNPWNAHQVELTAAGLDADVDVGVFHFGGRAEMRRPDRSRFLLSVLPIEWFCWQDPALARAGCNGDDAYYTWVADAGARLRKFSVDLGGQSSYARGTDASNFGGFANLRFLDLFARTHLDLGATAYTGSVLRSVAGTVAPGVVLAGGSADVSLRYRAAAVRYRADINFGFAQAIGAGLWASLADTVDLDLESDWLKERELDAVLLQGVVAWRPGG